MDDAELWHFMALQLIAGKTPVPLHRVLAHTLWRRSPLVAIRYEPDQDGALIQLVQAPTVAEAVIRAKGYAPQGDQPTATGANGVFIGFDGTDQDAWLTEISLPDFRRQRRTDGVTVALVRTLCGEHIWQAALAAAYDGTAKSAEVVIGPGEASMLIDRWRNMIAPPRASEMSHQELDAVFADWFAADPGRLGNQPKRGPS
jgi:hypothetical protein